MLAVAVSFAEAGEISSALGAWEEIAGDVDATARAALCSALVNSGETGVRARPRYCKAVRGRGSGPRPIATRHDHEGRAALSARVGTARNWAGRDGPRRVHELAAGGARVVVSSAAGHGAAAAARGRRRAGRYCHSNAPRHPAVVRRPRLRKTDRPHLKLAGQLFAEDAPDEVEGDTMARRTGARRSWIPSASAVAQRLVTRRRARSRSVTWRPGSMDMLAGRRLAGLGVRWSSSTVRPRLSSLAGSRRSPSSARVSPLRG